MFSNRTKSAGIAGAVLALAPPAIALAIAGAVLALGGRI